MDDNLFITNWENIYGEGTSKDISVIYEINEHEYVVGNGSDFLLFIEDESSIKVSSFSTFENGLIREINDEGIVISYNNDGETTLYNLSSKNGIQVSLIGDKETYNGLLTFVYYDSKEKKTFILEYDHQYNVKFDEYGVGLGHIYKYRTESDPYRVTFYNRNFMIKNPFTKKVSSYNGYDFKRAEDEGYNSFSEGPAYFKIFRFRDVIYLLNRFKYIGEIEQDLEDNGLCLGIPDELIEMYNRTYSKVVQYQNIVDELNEALKENERNIKLTLNND